MSPLPPVPRNDITNGAGILRPPWESWFAQLYTYLTAASGGGGGIVPATRSITGVAPLQGGGDLSADRTLTVQVNGITNTYLAQMAAATIKGNNTGGNANPLDLTVTQVQTLLAIPLPANPTGTIGLTVVNGVLASYLRSDSAPALSQAIVPIWTGNHRFTAGQGESYTIQAPATGAALTIPNNSTALLLNPAAGIATLGVTTPAIPFDGQVIRVATSQTITTLTMTANAGQTLKNAYAAVLNAGTGIAYLYNLANTTWYRIV